MKVRIGRMCALAGLIFGASAAVYAAGATKLEANAQKAWDMQSINKARSLFLEAAKLRAAEYEALKKRIAEAEEELDLSGEDFTGADKHLSLLAYHAGYDFFHAAETNQADHYFAKVAKDDERQKLVRRYKSVYEEPKDVPLEQAAKVWLGESALLYERENPEKSKEFALRSLAAGGGVAALDAVDKANAALVFAGKLTGKGRIKYLRDLATDAAAAKDHRVWAWNRIGQYSASSLSALEEADKAIAELGGKAERAWQKYIGELKAMERFPIAEKDLQLPSGNTTEGMTVRADDYLEDKDAENMTMAVQEAIDTKGVNVVVIGDIGRPWKVTTVKLRSNLTLRIEPGVRIIGERLSRTLKAMSGTILSIEECSNVTIEGLGKTPEEVFVGKFESLEERDRLGSKAFYSGSAIGIGKSRNIVIRNLTTGFNTEDGIGIGGIFSPSRDILLERVVSKGNYRQGMSVGSVCGLYVNNCVFADTKGNAPMAGIDFEPVYPSFYVNEVYFHDTEFRNNGGGGLLLALSSFSPITICARRCRFYAQPHSGLSATCRAGNYMARGMRPASKIIFEECRFERWQGQGAIHFYGKPIFDFYFRSCTAAITDNRAPGCVPDTSIVTTNLNWKGFNDWKSFPFDGIVDTSGLKDIGYQKPGL